MLEHFTIRSVVDLGCGDGTWLSVFHRAGVEEVQGYDGDHIDRSMLRIPAERFETADLSKPFRLSRRYDLACSLEVGEHLPQASADDLVSALVAAAPVVLFSAAIPRQGGCGHVNEQWQDWWAAKFATRGYVAIDLVRPLVWGDPEVAPWFQQNTIVYGDDANEEVARLAATHRPLRSLNCAHPAVYEGQEGARRALRTLARWPLRKMRSALRATRSG